MPPGSERIHVLNYPLCVKVSLHSLSIREVRQVEGQALDLGDLSWACACIVCHGRDPRGHEPWNIHSVRARAWSLVCFLLSCSAQNLVFVGRRISSFSSVKAPGPTLENPALIGAHTWQDVLRGNVTWFSGVITKEPYSLGGQRRSPFEETLELRYKE